jgi:hypothetical protein
MRLTAPPGALTTIDNSALVKTGCEFVDENGYIYEYLKGVASVAVGSWVALDNDDTDKTTALLTEAIGVKGVNCAVAIAAVVADKYGWFLKKGKVEGASLISNAADAQQYATTTAGSLDDAGTTPVHGVRLIDTATAAGNVTYDIDHPHTTPAP